MRGDEKQKRVVDEIFKPFSKVKQVGPGQKKNRQKEKKLQQQQHIGAQLAVVG